jgi:GNAT superfamily N-acetyltransferase
MRIEAADAGSEEVTRVFAAYLAEIEATFGYDSTQAVPTTTADFVPPKGTVMLVRDEHGAALGCGAVRLLDPSTAEVKRMWLDTPARGQGLGRALLAALEGAARELGATRGVLDTNVALASAIALYRAAGWQEIAAYNDNREATHWFEKPLPGS